MRRPMMLVLTAAVWLAGCSGRETAPVSTTSEAVVTEKTKNCLECHTKKQPSIVAMWRKSDMAKAGVGCYECHQAKKEDPDAQEHFDGNIISAIVSPLDCGRCHHTEMEQFLGSHHAKGGEVLGSLDNYLGEVVEGFAANVSGCQQCHGSKVIIEEDGKVNAQTWPNYGIGRMNPDGSSGVCAACHARHDFTKTQVRTPETCGRCHLGPDHPQIEIYHSSKHYLVYSSHMDEMNLEADPWVVGVDYTAAPNCATCHASATSNQPRSHEVAFRLSWNIRAEVSSKTKEWERKRLAMKDVCMNCHNPDYVDNFYQQYDAGVHLYNDKFATPAKKIMDRLTEAEKIDPTPFNEKIEWTYFYLWHHEGRRARNGLAMMGADYTQWHGFYEVAERFYLELIPEAEHLMPGVTKDIMAMQDHQWFTGMMSDGDRQAMADFYRKRYESRK